MPHEHHPDEPLIGPEITDWEPLWIVGYYDGPTSGMIAANGEMLWATMATECSDEPCGYYRRFQLMRLAPDIMATEVQRQEDFRTYVKQEPAGWSFAIEGYLPQTGWHLFYEKYANHQEPTGEPVGWISYT